MKKVKKSMLEWIPKWMKKHPKIEAGTALGDFCIDFLDFGDWSKKAYFSMPLGRTKKPQNRTRNGPKGDLPPHPVRRGYPARCPGTPGSGPRYHARATRIGGQRKERRSKKESGGPWNKGWGDLTRLRPEAWRIYQLTYALIHFTAYAA